MVVRLWKLNCIKFQKKESCIFCVIEEDGFNENNIEFKHYNKNDKLNEIKSNQTSLIWIPNSKIKSVIILIDEELEITK